MPKSRTSCLYIITGILLSLSLHIPQAKAQWMEQTISLKPGWNAVYLEVQPEPDECHKQFQNLPVESVWAWNRHFSPVQFIQDPSMLVPKQPGWLTYLPPENPGAFLTNLFTIQGGWAYLINLGGSKPVDWHIRGKPVYRSADWVPNSYSFVGFPVDPDAPPTFASFFASSSVHTQKPVYRLNPSNQWEITPTTELINPGEAYWIYCHGQSEYSGPLRVTLEQGRGIDFGRILTEQILRMRNETHSLVQITLDSQGSLAPPEGILPLLAGGVLLTYWDIDLLSWSDLSGQLQLNIQPGQELEVRLGIKRKDMPGSPDALYQSLLKISDSQGTCLFLPITAKGLSTYEHSSLAGTKRKRNGETGDCRTGLWVGMATINKVSHAASDDPNILQPTASEFQFRLIIHIDRACQARLLQQAILMWKEGTEKADPNDPFKWIVDKPGKFVILTRDDLIPQYSGAAIRDGKSVARRISSVAFACSDPDGFNMKGDLNTHLVCSGIELDYDHPLNPFKHKYHPNHDNLDYDFETLHPEGRESYTIVRNIELAFTTEDPEGLALSGWGDNQVGGIYRESIKGVHKKVLHVEGIFRLHQVSRVDVLNDGL